MDWLLDMMVVTYVKKIQDYTDFLNIKNNGIQFLNNGILLIYKKYLTRLQAGLKARQIMIAVVVAVAV